ncbi:hypothetical protein [Halovivax cerinus]|uniref:DUF7979 domain-containing protein n=1 Tax=Halovivax cerinus TaxID=1487865 RepID=A0ABD5NRI6_9EURY|nr:hypothetical protein [Halovivax cerinus]
MPVTIEPVDPSYLRPDATIRDYDELDEATQTEFARAVRDPEGCLDGVEPVEEYVKFVGYYRVTTCRRDNSIADRE